MLVWSARTRNEYTYTYVLGTGSRSNASLGFRQVHGTMDWSVYRSDESSIRRKVERERERERERRRIGQSRMTLRDTMPGPGRRGAWEFYLCPTSYIFHIASSISPVIIIIILSRIVITFPPLSDKTVGRSGKPLAFARRRYGNYSAGTWSRNVAQRIARSHGKCRSNRTN